MSPTSKDFLVKKYVKLIFTLKSLHTSFLPQTAVFGESPNLVTNIVTILVMFFFLQKMTAKFVKKKIIKFSDDFP